jgi:hypothetical protein
MIIEEQKLKISHVLLIFFSTLLSFYFPSLGGIRIFDFISFFILIYLTNTYFPENKKQKIIGLYFLLFALFIIISFFVGIFNSGIDLYLFKFLGTFFTIAYSIIFFIFFEKKQNILLKAINITVYLHALFFYLQFFIFYLLGTQIDFIKPITGNDSRNIGGQFNLDTSLRFSGLFGEAATYSLFILSLMLIVLIAKKKLNVFDFIVLLSIPLSTSASGTVYLMFFIAIYFIFYNRTSYGKKIIQIITLSIILTSAISFDLLKVDYLKEKIAGFEESSSYQYRIGNTNKVMADFTDSQIMFGIGYANMDIVENKGSTYSILMVEHGIILGGLFLLSILFLLSYFKVKYYIVFFVFLLFLGTHSFSQIQFWVWILSICILSTNNKLKKI